MFFILATLWVGEVLDFWRPTGLCVVQRDNKDGVTLDKGTDDLPKTELYTLVNTVFLWLN